jgi:hypothetical protein
MAKRRKRAATSRSSRKKRAPLKRRTAAKPQTTAKRLGDDVIAIPDGEVGPRKMWCMFLATDTYSKHHDLVQSRRPSPAVISNEEKPVGDKKTRPGAAPEYHWTFRVKDGVERLDFGELGYAAAARESYATFCRLRDEGVIAKGPRFQVSLVATDSGTNVYFDDVTTWPMVHAAYAKAMKAEISKMLEVIPADDLAIQLDLAWAKQRIGLAKRYLFGISAVCGFGRENPHEFGNILELHKAAAGSLAT